MALVESLGSLLQNGITLMAMLAVLLPYGPWLPAALLVSTLPALYVVLRYALLQHHWRQRSTADERRAWYYDWLLSAGEAAAEMRLFGLQDHFRSGFRGLRAETARASGWRWPRRRAGPSWRRGWRLAGDAAAAIGWMGWRRCGAWPRLGDLALFYQAFQQGLGLMRSLLDHVGQLYQNSLFLGNLFEFLALEPKVVDPPAAAARARVLCARGSVSAMSLSVIPGKERTILEDFDLTIPAGQHRDHRGAQRGGEEHA